MGLFRRHHYPGAYGMPAQRRSGKGVLAVIAIVLGAWFLNLAFAWVKVPTFSASGLKIFNIVTGIFLVIIGIAVLIRPRYY